MSLFNITNLFLRAIILKHMKFLITFLDTKKHNKQFIRTLK